MPQSKIASPRKQRHTVHRIYERICAELPKASMAEHTVCQYIQRRKHALGVAARQITVPQEYHLGQEAQVDWYEATIQLDSQPQKMQFFTMRSMASGAAYHCAYFHATQQAFLEAHQRKRQDGRESPVPGTKPLTASCGRF